MFLLLLLAWQGGYQSSGSANIYKGRTQGIAYKISISDSLHDVYGLSYPATYQIDIPAGESGLHGYYSYDNYQWQELTERDTTDWFNGIEAIRFDYTNNKAYVSVPLDSNSSHIDIKITRGIPASSLSDISIDSITRYYDNRKAVVTITADEWRYDTWWADSMIKACNVCRSESLWITTAIVTDSASHDIGWDHIQDQINEGYVEAASHSVNHLMPPYDSLSSNEHEVGYSKQMIIDSLEVDLYNRSGSNEYVPCWISPYGACDSLSEVCLGENKYLVNRIVNQRGYFFGIWIAIYNHYYRIGKEYNLDNCGNAVERDKADSIFAWCYNNNNIYSLMCHPTSCNWSAGSFERQHLDSIAGHKDVWYVGFGHLYMYHYLQERDQLSYQTYTIWNR